MKERADRVRVSGGYWWMRRRSECVVKNWGDGGRAAREAKGDGRSPRPGARVSDNRCSVWAWAYGESKVGLRLHGRGDWDCTIIGFGVAMGMAIGTVASRAARALNVACGQASAYQRIEARLGHKHGDCGECSIVGKTRKTLRSPREIQPKVTPPSYGAFMSIDWIVS
ncbi:hypothetical protein B0H14DRAFT_3166469 [Mycena olivaceomarginata]|nr:hypothetical protein B0H14DRAFT_3166469 [Mycena olivaceomarginata]